MTNKEKGYSQQMIAKVLGIAQSMISAIIKKSAPSCDHECLKAQLDKYHKKACKQSGDKFKLRKKGTGYFK